jgi:hypothetical protein
MGFESEFAERLSGAGGSRVPKWAVARPITFYFFDSLKFDYAKLGFFIEHGHTATMARLRYAERRYHELKLFAEQYNTFANRKNERMAARFPVGSQASINDVQEVIGPDIRGGLETMIDAIAKHVGSDSRDYEAAEIALREATAAIFPRKPKLGIQIGRRETSQKADVVATSFHAEILQIVARQVNRTLSDTVARLAGLDRLLMEVAEAMGAEAAGKSERILALLESHVTELERRFEASSGTEKPELALILRDMYQKYEQQARNYYASSLPYRKVRERVLAGLAKIEAIGVQPAS